MKWFLESLPRDWQTKALKRVSLLRYGDSLAVEDREDGDTPVYGSNGVVGTHSCANQLAPGLVVGRKGSYGKVTYCDEPCFVIDTAYGIDASCTRHDMRWLYYVVSSSTIDSKMRDSPVPGLASRDAYRIELPVPPSTEQKRIAAYLDASCAAIDRAVATKQQQLETLDALRKSIIQKAVTQGLNPEVEMKDSGVDWLGPVPRHWEVARIKRHTAMIRGKFSHRPRNDPALYDGPYPFFQTGSIASAEKYITEYKQTLNEDGLAVSRMFPKGIVVMSIAANIGDVAITGFEGCFPDSIVGFIPDYHTNTDFLFYLLKSMKPVMLRSAILTTQLNLNYVRIGANHCAFPPKPEQEVIATFLDNKMAELRNVSSVIENQIETLTAYRKSLIHECVTGQRRITDADVAAVSRTIEPETKLG